MPVTCPIPEGTRRRDDVVLMSKRRHCAALTSASTSLRRRVPAGIIQVVDPLFSVVLSHIHLFGLYGYIYKTTLNKIRFAKGSNSCYKLICNDCDFFLYWQVNA